MGRRQAPEVNAGSMADIAFLLLIFFLVTTTIDTDSGISRKLPPIQPENVDPPIIKQKNIFTVVVNKNNDLLVEDQVMKIEELREATVKFLDNGGGTNDAGQSCDYCKGAKDPSSSDHPDKAIISVKNDRETDYKTYISVQNELVAAYNELRNREAQRLYKMDYTDMDAILTDPEVTEADKEKYQPRIDKIKGMYKQVISEAEPTKN